MTEIQKEKRKTQGSKESRGKEERKKYGKKEGNERN